MKTMNLFYLIPIAIVMTFTLGACEKKGPAEKAGQKIDQAVEQTKDNLQEAKEAVKDKMTTDGPAENAGEKIDQAVEKAKKEARQAKENVKEAVKTN